jgi:SpoVK/Ycf46/Vps4 family AAA+-type ATPase
MLSRTAKVLTMIAPKVADQSALCKSMIDENLVAQRYLPTGAMSASINAARYEPAWVNCATNLINMANKLQDDPSVRVLLYGPPGTGKTAFGHWLARQLDKPLLLRKVSDLLGMHVGESEQKIAEAFEEAQKNQCILMIDEVDSFLQSRNNAQRNWEVTLVNEMLTQIENFEGIFIASTNLSETLDSAAFRRFDLKLHFDYLRKDQLLQLVQRELHNAWGNDDTPMKSDVTALQFHLRDIGQCTPGDVAAVVRQHRLNPIKDESDFATRLKADLQLRHKEHRSIGFLG